MSMAARIDAAIGNPVALEALYRAAVEAGELEEFAAEIVRRHALAPEDVLVAAWFHRLGPRPVPTTGGAGAAGAGGPGTVTAMTGAEAEIRPAATVPLAMDALPARDRRAQWRLALLLSAVLSLVSITLGSNDRWVEHLLFLWAPATTTLLLVYLGLGRRGSTSRSDMPSPGELRRRTWIAVTVLAVLTVIADQRSGGMRHGTPVDLLTSLHLPALAWLALGWAVLGAEASPLDVFAAVRKSIETLITAGLFAGAGMALVMTTMGLFHAIGVTLPNWLTRDVVFGGPALIPVLAVATVYDPDRLPSEQRGDHGLARIIFTAGRLFLPLTLAVLAIYLVAIPFRFMEPFRNRDVLVTYNAMLFAIMFLLVAATPVLGSEVSGPGATWLRRGIVAVAACALLVSLYAMAAIVYRTAGGGLTVNRLTVIGWNIVNIATLTLLLYRQGSDGKAAWIAAAHRAFRAGLYGYMAWTLFVLVVIPLLRLEGR
jgi:hypothetical protein